MKVKAIAGEPEGLIGEVKYVDTDHSLAVAFEGFDGHRCDGTLEEDNGWFMGPYELEIISEELAVCLQPNKITLRKYVRKVIHVYACCLPMKLTNRQFK